MKTLQIYRWHLVRLYRIGQLAARFKEDYIEISIHPYQNKELLANSFLEMLLHEKEGEPLSDNYNLWDLSDENALAGIVRPKTILKYLFDQQALNKALKQDRIPMRRNSNLLKKYKLEEDMVFLQVCTDPTQFKQLFQKFKDRPGIHNIDPVLTQSQSMLIDYTQQARHMASQIYEDVMIN